MCIIYIYMYTYIYIYTPAKLMSRRRQNCHVSLPKFVSRAGETRSFQI